MVETDPIVLEKICNVHGHMDARAIGDQKCSIEHSARVSKNEKIEILSKISASTTVGSSLRTHGKGV